MIAHKNKNVRVRVEIYLMKKPVERIGVSYKQSNCRTAALVNSLRRRPEFFIHPIGSAGFGQQEQVMQKCSPQRVLVVYQGSKS